jgi:hypothetical protein
MDNKALECFACEPRARGVRIDISPQQSLVLPHEHFIYAEFCAREQSDSLKLVFVTHEIKLTGFLLRRIENAVVDRDLSWLCARPEKFRPQNVERPFITKLVVRMLEQPSSGKEA